MRKIKKVKGFTLLEIVISISVIMIAVSVLFNITLNKNDNEEFTKMEAYINAQNVMEISKSISNQVFEDNKKIKFNSNIKVLDKGFINNDDKYTVNFNTTNIDLDIENKQYTKSNNLNANLNMKDTVLTILSNKINPGFEVTFDTTNNKKKIIGKFYIPSYKKDISLSNTNKLEDNTFDFKYLNYDTKVYKNEFIDRLLYFSNKGKTIELTSEIY